MGKIGIMGGTFNPIHIGHLIIAEDVQEKCGLDKVMFIPSGLPPHKPDSEVIDPEHRYEMVRLATASNPGFETSRMEIDREGYTYTVNTLQELSKQYGEGTSFYFIIGADVISELITWKDYIKVFQLCEFIAVMRPGYSLSDFSREVEQLEGEMGARIHPLESRLIDISSTDIRNNCINGASIRYLVPDAVREYIIDNGLYRTAFK